MKQRLVSNYKTNKQVIIIHSHRTRSLLPFFTHVTPHSSTDPQYQVLVPGPGAVYGRKQSNRQRSSWLSTENVFQAVTRAWAISVNIFLYSNCIFFFDLLSERRTMLKGTEKSCHPTASIWRRFNRVGPVVSRVHSAGKSKSCQASSRQPPFGATQSLTRSYPSSDFILSEKLVALTEGCCHCNASWGPDWQTIPLLIIKRCAESRHIK